MHPCKVESIETYLKVGELYLRLLIFVPSFLQLTRIRTFANSSCHVSKEWHASLAGCKWLRWRIGPAGCIGNPVCENWSAVCNIKVKVLTILWYFNSDVSGGGQWRSAGICRKCQEGSEGFEGTEIKILIAYNSACKSRIKKFLLEDIYKAAFFKITGMLLYQLMFHSLFKLSVSGMQSSTFSQCHVKAWQRRKHKLQNEATATQ